MDEAPSDAELWARISRHDGRAFATLFDRHSEALYNHCFRRTASWSLAEELTSITWSEVWRRRKGVRLHSDSILPWILAVSNNCRRNLERSQRRYRNLLAKMPTPSSNVFADELDQRLDDERRMSEVLAALAALRMEDQEVVSLCDWAGLSYAEVATALHVPIGTVRSRLSRAHEKLRGALDSATSVTPTGETTSQSNDRILDGEP